MKRSWSRQPKVKVTPNKDDLEKILQDKSIREVSEHYKTSPNRINRLCKAYGIVKPAMDHRRSNPTQTMISSAAQTRKVTRPSKEELNKLLWEKPTTEIAKMYGVSDKAVSKWALSYGIDKPSRGYWAKLASENKQ